MTNPLESYGWSDDDYDVTIGALVGEAGDHARGQARVNEMAGILDVAENRRSSARSGGRQFNAGSNPTLKDVFEARRQFDAVTRTGNAAHANFQTGKRAARNEAYLASLTPTQREKVEAAKQAALGIASRELRGLSKNATMTSSAAAGVARSQRRAHNAEGLRTATRIGGTNFYGTSHNRNLTQEQAVSIANQRDKTAAARSRAPTDTPLERNLPGMMDSRRDYSQFGKEGTPREAIPPEARPAYSAAALDFGPDFSSPPSQARGAVENPYGFSNIDTAREAVPGSFAGYGPGAFGALDQPVDYGRTYPEISAGLYPDIAPPDVPAVPNVMDQFPERPFDFNAAFEGFPEDDATGAIGNAQISLSALSGPGYAAGTGAQLGTPDFSAASALDREAAYQAEVAAMRDPAAAQARGGWSDQVGTARAMDAQPTNFQGGLYGDPAMPAGSFTSGLDFGQPLGPSPDRFSGGAVPNPFSPDAAAFNSQMSDLLQPGPAPAPEMSPFQNTPLGIGQGILDQGPYNSPIGYADRNNSFALANQAPAAVSTQAPATVAAAPSRGVVDYENKTITRDVPNPAWSDWSRDYATRNAAQDAWLAADEDKFGVDRGAFRERPFDMPAILADTKWSVQPEPPKTIAQTTTVRSPVYGDIPAASVPAVNARPASGSAIQAQPATWSPAMTQQAQNFSSLLGSLGGYGLQGVPGTFDTGFNLAGMGGGSYGGWGGGYDPGGYGGGYGGVAPGDAGYGSDARSGMGNMGAGNLYQ